MKKSKMTRSPLWFFFKKIDRNFAICLFCNNRFSHLSTTGNLKKHYERIHAKDYGALEDLDPSIIADVLESSKNKDEVVFSPNGHHKERAKRSPIWKYFDTGDSSNARCKQCFKTMPINYTNMIKHLEIHHERAYNDYKETKGTRFNSSNTNSSESGEEIDDHDEIWNFIEYVGGNTYCVVCRDPLERKVEEVRRHIRNHHPKLAKSHNSIRNSSDNEASDNDNEDDTYTEVVYLETNEKSPPPISEIVRRPSVKKEKYKKSKKPKPYDRIPKVEKTENVIRYEKVHNSETDDDLHTFSKYILSLLKSLPSRVNNKLQLDIINMILKAKMDHEAPPARATNEKYIIMNSQEPRDMNDVQVEVLGQSTSPSLMISIAAEEAGIENSISNKTDDSLTT